MRHRHRVAHVVWDLRWLISREEFQPLCSSQPLTQQPWVILFYSLGRGGGWGEGEKRPSVIWSFLVPDNAVMELAVQVPWESVCPRAHSSNGEGIPVLITISEAELTILNPEG